MADSPTDSSDAAGGRRCCRDVARRLRWFFREHPWAVIGALWLLAYVLGCVGVAKQFAATGERRSASDPFFRGLQLFIMDDSMVTNGPLVSWELEVARFLAPAVAAYAALAAFLALFRERLQLFRLRYFRRHVVICGLGRNGFALAEDFRRHGHRVVVVERDDANPRIPLCREQGIIVLVGDATVRAVLEKAGVASAQYVIAICGDDGTNAEIAIRAHQTVLARSPRLTGTVRCFVHIVELHLCELFSQHRIFADLGDPFEANIFNIYQSSARLLFEDHPPDRGLIVAGDSRTPHLIVLGFGRMGESVALQAAKIGHYASGQRPRITIIDRDAESRQNRFYGRYPQFEQVCAVEFVHRDWEDPETRGMLRRWAAERECVVTVVVALDDDRRALACALGVLSAVQAEGVPLMVRMSEEAGLATLLESPGRGRTSLATVRPFGMPRCVCTRRMLLNEELDVLSRGIHEAYAEPRRRPGAPTTDPNVAPWDELDHGLKDSCRQQADHLPIKLRTIGCSVCRGDRPEASVQVFSDAEVETLARMEHARWMAERLLAGWRLGPKNVDDKTSPHLVDWQVLPEEIMEYDRQAVRQIPRLLQTIGAHVQRRAADSTV